MATVNIYTYVEVLGAGPTMEFGSKSVPVSVTLDSTNPEIFKARHQVATVTATEILRVGTAAGDDIKAFKVLIIKPEDAATISWESGDATDNSSVDVAAGHTLILTSDDTTDYAATGTLRVAEATDLIEKVFAYRDGSGTKYVDVIALY